MIKDDSVRVCLYEGAPDYGADVAATFARFAEHPTASYLVKLSDHAEMNHIEAAILSRVERLHPELFARLGAYCDRYRTYLDDKIVGFDREVEFYLSYLDYVAPARGAGLQRCYPHLSTTWKAIRADAIFDLALAIQPTKAGDPVVTNELHLEGEERIFVVSGPNQGGKTTFARTFGQLHYLASLGLLVPGREAHLREELGEDFFAEAQGHLKRLRFRTGVPISARLGKGLKGMGYVLRRSEEGRLDWIGRLFAPSEERGYTFRLQPRDEAGARCAGELRDRGINLVADALGKSADHVLAFFRMLRTELAFFLGCANLKDALEPSVQPSASRSRCPRTRPASRARGSMMRPWR